MNRFLPLATLVASLLLASAPTSAQRLNVNPYVGLGFDVPADPDLCKVGTSGVDADARETAGNIAEASGSPPELEINNCHLHAVADSFVVSSGSASLCHPDHEPPDGNCGRPGWCVNPCIRLPAVGGGAGAGAGLGPEACGQTNCLRARCPVILTTYEVLAPSWTYTFPPRRGQLPRARDRRAAPAQVPARELHVHVVLDLAVSPTAAFHWRR